MAWLKKHDHFKTENITKSKKKTPKNNSKTLRLITFWRALNPTIKRAWNLKFQMLFPFILLNIFFSFEFPGGLLMLFYFLNKQSKDVP